MDEDDKLIIFGALLLYGSLIILTIWGMQHDENLYASREAICAQHNGTYLQHDDVCIAAPSINLDKNK